MGVEATSETVARGWPEAGSLINGVYPLMSMLHSSDRSAVFMTEARARGVAAAAIKIVRAAPVLTDLQLRHWRIATALSHPHLLRLFDSGHCQLAGQPFLFVVMEYADQTLAQVLPKRALTADEAREMLSPALDALAFLHRKNLVHGQLKPANFLVVGDQLKLASDTIRPAGQPRAGNVVRASTILRKYSTADPPPLRISGVWASRWSRRSPRASRGRTRKPSPCRRPCHRPSSDVAQRCLSLDPTARPTAAELHATLLRAADTPAAAARAARRSRSPVGRATAVAPVAPERGCRRRCGTRRCLCAGMGNSAAISRPCRAGGPQRRRGCTPDLSPGRASAEHVTARGGSHRATRSGQLAPSRQAACRTQRGAQSGSTHAAAGRGGALGAPRADARHPTQCPEYGPGPDQGRRAYHGGRPGRGLRCAA